MGEGEASFQGLALLPSFWVPGQVRMVHMKEYGHGEGRQGPWQHPVSLQPRQSLFGLSIPSPETGVF